MLHADTPHWGSLFDTFAGFQILFLDPIDTLIALGHTIPFVWDGTLEDLPPTIDEVMERVVDAHRERSAPTALSALAALVSPKYQGRHLSSEILSTMRSLAAEHGMHSLVAPVRPTLKGLYPLIPIEAGVTPGKIRAGGPSDQDISRVPSLCTTTVRPRDW